jgi:NAD+ diphosphatase
MPLSKRLGLRYLVGSEALSSIAPENAIYLGHLGDMPIFTVEISQKHHAESIAQLPENTDEFDANNYYWSDFRRCLFSVEPAEQEVVLTAAGLLQWHQTHGFCGQCGYKTKMIEAGHARQCTNKSCKKNHFPRIEPAVIFSVERRLSDGSTELLLARQKHWPANRWSVLAGFVEHGETLEQAVYREAREEAGILVSDVCYFDSQPWPFPASLMIAFTAYTEQQTLTLTDQELAEASWFNTEAFLSAIKSERILPPLKVSLSSQLIARWFMRQTGQSLNAVLSGGG